MRTSVHARTTVCELGPVEAMRASVTSTASFPNSRSIGFGSRAFACFGVGPGFFGVQALHEVVGVALHTSVGLRYAIDDSLSVRLDAAPTFTIPVDSPIGPAGHISIFLRGESRF